MTKTLGKKILILGNGGSGKSTLAKTLAKKLAIPVLHLDSIYWKNGWEKQPLDFFYHAVNEHMKKAAWIIEGTPMPGIEQRVMQADTIIFLDVPVWACVYRVLKRKLFASFRAQKVEDGCPALQLNRQTLLWLWRFPMRQQVKIYALLAEKTNAIICNIKNNANVFD